MLVAIVSHFLEPETKLEVLGSGRSAASDSLVLHVPSSVARNPPNGAGEWW
jgi:hypothetical protein